MEPQLPDREWFEPGEPKTFEQIQEEAFTLFGINTPEFDCLSEDEQRYQMRRAQRYIAAARRRSANGMSLTETQERLATASLFTDQAKTLPADIRERTGLEMNPLWMLEVMVRSGTLNNKEKIAALSKLAEYTHSKAPSFTAQTANLTPEEWLAMLAKQEYPEVAVGPRQVDPEVEDAPSPLALRPQALDRTKDLQQRVLDQVLREFENGDPTSGLDGPQEAS